MNFNSKRLGKHLLLNVLQYQKEGQLSQETVANLTAHLQHVSAQYQIGTVALASPVELR